MIKNKKIIIGICVVVIIALIGFIIYKTQSKNISVNSKLMLSQDEESQEKINYDEDLIKTREEVVSKFEKDGIKLTNGKFFENSYKKYPNDEIISTICNYYFSKENMDFYSSSSDINYKNSAMEYASLISPDYDGFKSEEIINYAQNLLGDKWKEINEKSKKQNENYKNLTIQQKKDIYNKVLEKINSYGDQAEKYIDIIYNEIKDEYGISYSNVQTIFSDTDIINQASKENLKTIEYDATLEYNNGTSIIAVDEKALDDYLVAISNKNEKKINYMIDNLQIGKVPIDTHVNIIEKKLSKAKVKILDGIYKDNEAWVLIESLKEK